MITRTALACMLLALFFSLSATLASNPVTNQDAPAVPAELNGFRGIMTGKLVEKGDKAFVFEIQKIKKVWKANKAEQPEKAVGQKVTINFNKVIEHHREKIMANYAAMSAGDSIEVEAFDEDGKFLSVKELLRKAE